MSLWDNMLASIQGEWTDRGNFLRQKTISKTVHPNSAGTAQKYAFKYAADEILRPDPKYGNPILNGDYSLVTLQSTMYIRILKDNNLLDGIDEIWDVGAGYGNLAWLLRENGYTGKYTCIDFPLMHEIQQTWLEKAGITNVDFGSLDDIIPRASSLMIATHSINEMPLSDREKIPWNYFGKVFVAHNHVIDGIDNVKYFMELRKEHSDFNWTSMKSPMQQSHWHFWGTK